MASQDSILERLKSAIGVASQNSMLRGLKRVLDAPIMDLERFEKALGVPELDLGRLERALGVR